MVNVASVVANFSLIGGVVALAVWAFYEIRSHQNNQEEQRQRYETRPRGNNNGTRKIPPQPANECAICRDDLTAPLEILPCAHIYHRVCIQEWFNHRLICPYCNVPIPDDMKEEYRRRLRLRHD